MTTRRHNLLFLALLGILLTLSLAGCGGGGSSGPSTVFQDNFDSYPLASPWTPAGGWSTDNPNAWAIVAGLSGNGVQLTSISGTRLTSSYTGSDYTVSARVRMPTLVYDWEFGIFARDDSANHRYCARIINWTTGGNRTEVRITKYHDATDHSVASSQLFAHDLDTSIYYTLTLHVSGNVITATLTDGTNTATCTYTDGGITHGVVIYSGLAGIEASSSVAGVTYDNFMVTTP